MSSVKVYLRIRPAEPSSQDETKSPEPVRCRSPSPGQPLLQIVQSKSAKSCIIRSDKKHFNERKFDFEDVFQETAGQTEVFGRFKGRLVESAINGVGL
jgi:hypothetical protein